MNYRVGVCPRLGFVTKINSEYYKFVSAEDAEQDKFDDETRHGVDSDKEAEWEKKYDVH